jgi:hypothetical protein
MIPERRARRACVPRETPMTAEEIADELVRLALEGQRIALGGARERGH